MHVAAHQLRRLPGWLSKQGGNLSNTSIDRIFAMVKRFKFMSEQDNFSNRGINFLSSEETQNCEISPMFTISEQQYTKEMNIKCIIRISQDKISFSQATELFIHFSKLNEDKRFFSLCDSFFYLVPSDYCCQIVAQSKTSSFTNSWAPTGNMFWTH